jgi:uncharacterized protein YndB with AHSA1/START domain
MTGIEAVAEVTVAAPVERVWSALTEPAEVARWMFGTRLETDWTPGGPVTWSGEYQGHAYQDRGEVLEFSPPTVLVVTHYSPMSGQPDFPESYHTVTYRLAADGAGTRVLLTQDNNGSPEEAEHSRRNWLQALAALKAVVERD